MAKQKLLITADSWHRILGELSKEMDKMLDVIPENNAYANSLTLYLNTLREFTNKVFSYLPEAERENIKAFGGAWMVIGILYGQSPETLLNILERTGAKGFLKWKEGDQHGSKFAQ